MADVTVITTNAAANTMINNAIQIAQDCYAFYATLTIRTNTIANTITYIIIPHIFKNEGSNWQRWYKAVQQWQK